MTLLAGVFVQLVEGVDIDVKHVVILEEDANGLLLFAADSDAMKPGKAADAVVNVDDEVADGQVLDFAEAQPAVATLPSPRRWPVIAVEDLVVRIDGQSEVGDFEPFVKRFDGKPDFLLHGF